MSDLPLIVYPFELVRLPDVHPSRFSILSTEIRDFESS